MCLLDSAHTPKLCFIKAPSYFHRAHYSSLCQADLFCKSYLSFMWCSQTLTLHSSFANSFTLVPAKWLLEIPFCFFISDTLFLSSYFCKGPLTCVKWNNTGSFFGLQMVLQIWIVLSQDIWTIFEALEGKGWCDTPAEGLA